jgi:hypothetical protein
MPVTPNIIHTAKQMENAQFVLSRIVLFRMFNGMRPVKAALPNEACC